MSTATKDVALKATQDQKAIIKDSKPEQPAKVVQLTPPDSVPSLENRIHRLNQLFELQAKYNRLHASLLKLQTFKIEKNGEYSQIVIRDDNRTDFTTGNPDVIADVVKFMTETIQRKIKEIEPLLVW